MRSLVGEWISNLAMLAILAALVDMILPNGNFRKYTGFIFGLVILVMFINPLLQITNQAEQFNNSVSRNIIAQRTETAVFQSSQTEKGQRERIEQVFRESLEKNLAADLKYKVGLDNAKVKIHFGERNGETDLSVIQRIDISADFKKNRSVNIDPVVIDTSRKLGETIADAEEEEKISEVKEYISGMYDIHVSNIYINRK